VQRNMYIAQPPATPQVDVASCVLGEGSITITMPDGGNPPYKYSIDGGATYEDTNVFENLPVGTYEVVVMDNNGCSSTSAVSVEVYEPLQLDTSIAHLLYCNNTEAEISIEVKGGSGNFTYDVYHVEGDTYTVE